MGSHGSRQWLSLKDSRDILPWLHGRYGDAILLFFLSGSHIWKGVLMAKNWDIL